MKIACYSLSIIYLQNIFIYSFCCREINDKRYNNFSPSRISSFQNSQSNRLTTIWTTKISIWQILKEKGRNKTNTSEKRMFWYFNQNIWIHQQKNEIFIWTNRVDTNSIESKKKTEKRTERRHNCLRRNWRTLNKLVWPFFLFSPKSTVCPEMTKTEKN